MIDFITWWGWRRWRIYCPSYKVTHLFDHKGDFEKSLFDWDEAFVSPCTLNEVWCGGVRGKWTPKIRFMPPITEREDEDEKTQDDKDGY